MKKIILTLGLSTLLTMSNLLASDLKISEPLADQPLTVENRFKGFYIKPFAGIWGMSIIDEVSSKTVDVPALDRTTPEKGVVSSLCEMQTTVGYIFGVAVGKHLNEYIGIESSIGYYYSNNFTFIHATQYNVNNNIGTSGYALRTSYLGIINTILSPVINANITENISLYFTAGVGASYIMFSNDAKNWYPQTYQKLLLSLDKQDFSGVKADEVKRYNNAQKVHLSWAVGAGVRTHLTESTELDIGYSYKSLGKLPTSRGYQYMAKDAGVSAIESMPLLIHEVRVGLKFNF